MRLIVTGEQYFAEVITAGGLIDAIVVVNKYLELIGRRLSQNKISKERQ